MNLSRRSFLEAAFASAAMPVFSGCLSGACSKPKPGIAVQLYSIRSYIGKNGLEKSLEDVRKIGYAAVEFAGYHGKKAPELKKILDSVGLVACGTHCGIPNKEDDLKRLCEFNVGYGNKHLVCPWGGGKTADDWKRMGENFAKAADIAAQFGCTVGYHNHQHEFRTKFDMPDGTKKCCWDLLFTAAGNKVMTEMDVGWATAAGEDPEFWFKKFPNRALTIHAKETVGGVAKNLYDTGKPGVDWDKVARLTYADITKWWVVECERGAGTLDYIKGSYEVLKPYCS